MTMSLEYLTVVPSEEQQYDYEFQECSNADGTIHITVPAADGDPTRLSPLGYDFLKTRYDFVQAMGWLPDAIDDIDVYDSDPRTRYIMRSNPANPNELYTGMRLTKVDSLQDSLTWHMMDGNPAMQQSALRKNHTMKALDKVAERGELYDLTRLVLSLEENRIPRDEVEDSIRDIFAGGLAATAEHPDSNPAWVFLTGSSFKKYLDKLGIETLEITRQKVGEDDGEESALCAAFPRAALEYARHMPVDSYRRTYERITERAESFS